jgi:hypothetical protein
MAFRNIIRFVELILILGLVNNCISYKKHPKELDIKKIKECRGNWIYQDLKLKQTGKILFYSKKFDFDLLSFPNFLIVATNNCDTIGFLDKDFNGKLKKGMNVELIDCFWSDKEKELKKPIFTVSKRKFENYLFCKIHKIYFGKLRVN